MKKFLFTFLLCGLLFTSYAQDMYVEKSSFGFQTGLLGFWLYNEARLSKDIVLRSEIGLTSEFYKGGYYGQTWFLVGPSFTLEPKWYYNMAQRKHKNKNITGNSANYFSISTKYIPNWFVASTNDNLTYFDQISIIPTWGIRRSIGKHFNYEAGLGVGYIHFFQKNAGFSKNEGNMKVNLHLRIGYTF